MDLYRPNHGKRITGKNIMSQLECSSDSGIKCQKRKIRDASAATKTFYLKGYTFLFDRSWTESASE